MADALEAGGGEVVRLSDEYHNGGEGAAPGGGEAPLPADNATPRTAPADSGSTHFKYL
jgi:hypothetical protein